MEVLDKSEKLHAFGDSLGGSGNKLYRNGARRAERPGAIEALLINKINQML